MPNDVLIDLDEDVIACLTLKAELKGRSLEDELREIITAAALPDANEGIAEGD